MEKDQPFYRFEHPGVRNCLSVFYISILPDFSSCFNILLSKTKISEGNKETTLKMLGLEIMLWRRKLLIHDLHCSHILTLL
jgi:hypothetical protein